MALSPKLGQVALIKLIKEVGNFERNKGLLGHLRGMVLGVGNEANNIYLMDIGKRNIDIHVTGKSIKGWKAVIEDAAVNKSGFIEITARFTKDNEGSLVHVVEIGRFVTKTKDGDFFDVISKEELPKRALKELILNTNKYDPVEYDKRLEQLMGYKMPPIDSMGAININLAKEVDYPFRVLGFLESGWAATLTSHRIIQEGKEEAYNVFTLDFSKNGEASFSRAFEIGREKKQELIDGVQQDIFNIVPLDRKVKDILRNILLEVQGYDAQNVDKQFNELEQIYLDPTSKRGVWGIRLAKGAFYTAYVLGASQEGWSSKMTKHYVNRDRNRNEYNEFVLLFSKPGQPSYTRYFEIGRERGRMLSDDGTMKDYLKIVPKDDMGQMDFIDFIQKLKDLPESQIRKEFDQIIERPLGLTNDEGELELGAHIEWKALDIPRSSGWRVAVVAASIDGKKVRFTAEFRKLGNKAYERDFEIVSRPDGTVKIVFISSLRTQEINLFDLINMQKDEQLRQEVFAGFISKFNQRKDVFTADDNKSIQVDFMPGQGITFSDLSAGKEYTAEVILEEGGYGLFVHFYDEKGAIRTYDVSGKVNGELIGKEFHSPIVSISFDAAREEVRRTKQWRVLMQRPSPRKLIRADSDDAMSSSYKGGIDLNADNVDLQVQNNGQGIDFKPDPAMLERLQNAAGFTPTIIGIEPLGDVRGFLGANPIAN